jgi:hypothetical protein
MPSEPRSLTATVIADPQRNRARCGAHRLLAGEVLIGNPSISGGDIAF